MHPSKFHFSCERSEERELQEGVQTRQHSMRVPATSGIVADPWHAAKAVFCQGLPVASGLGSEACTFFSAKAEVLMNCPLSSIVPRRKVTHGGE